MKIKIMEKTNEFLRVYPSTTLGQFSEQICVSDYPTLSMPHQQVRPYLWPRTIECLQFVCEDDDDDRFS